jgi:hypothetical protein
VVRQVLTQVRKFAIFCHRWMGLAFCVLFAWWFASGLFMMYWDFPGVTQADRLDRSDAIDANKIKLSPEEAWAKLGREGSPAAVQLAMFDGRPVYRFTMAGGRGGRGGGAAARNTGKAGATDTRSVGRGRGDAAAENSGGRGRRGSRRPDAAGVVRGRPPVGVTGGPPARITADGKGRATANAETSGVEAARGGSRRGAGGAGQSVVYADDGSVQEDYSKELLLRIAAHWTGQPGSSARIEEITAVDQWTVAGGLRSLRPLWKYTFTDGEQVYVNGRSGEVVQYTTLGSRIMAHLGPIPHWLYYTPLRTQQKLWTNVVIWSSGIGTVMALMGLMVGISLYSPSKKYRFEGQPSTVPYTGQKRLHMILGLFFGILTCTWAFSGMLSMDPFPVPTNRGPGGGTSPTGRIQAALRPGRFDISDFAEKSPQAALSQLGSLSVKQLDLSSFDGQPIYVAALGSGETRIVPVRGEPAAEFDKNRILEMVASAALPVEISEKRMLTQYDAYYLDRHHERPLPVLFVRMNDPEATQLYIDQRTARLVGEHSNASSFVTRWLYHGLHSLDFPWLYNHRPAWDIVVLALMLGGLSLCVTSMIMGWQLLRRKLSFRRKPLAVEGL